MKVLIRADASDEIGTGHVMRCLSLAAALTEKGANVAFVCRDLQGNIIRRITQSGFPVHRIARRPTNPSGTFDVDGAEDVVLTAEFCRDSNFSPDWIIVDHYALDRSWETPMRRFGRVMAIDDTADRQHDCDVLLDQNFHVNGHMRYRRLVPEDCVFCVGPQYALIRPEFVAAREHLRVRDGVVRRILICFGGTDAKNVTERTLNALSALGRSYLKVVVVLGETAVFRDRVRDICASQPHYEFHSPAADMSALMAEADLAIGAGGSTTWERCCLALPSVIVATAPNQQPAAEALAGAGRALYLGPSEAVGTEALRTTIGALLHLPTWVAFLSQACGELTDGYGCRRVIDTMMALISGSKTVIAAS